MPNIVDIAVPVGVRKTFSYSVPRALQGKIDIGMRVLVPFGPKLLTGYVVGFPEKEAIRTTKRKVIAAARSKSTK